MEVNAAELAVSHSTISSANSSSSSPTECIGLTYLQQWVSATTADPSSDNTRQVGWLRVPDVII
jgi:hypothetical protein